MGGERRVVAVEGSTFSVWQRGEEAEIYRTSPEFLPRMSTVFARAEKAVRIATGCVVSSGSMVGDAALMKARLDCP